MTGRSCRKHHADRGGTRPWALIRSRVLSHAVQSSLAAATGFSAHTARHGVEMSVPWKSQNDFHRPLEISHSTRDFHIPTAGSFFEEKKKNTGEEC
jgi:hypothetical protein